VIAVSVPNAERASGSEIRTTPRELATELAVLTEVDWRKVWPGASGEYEPDPAWLAQFGWQVVNFQWMTNSWGPITVRTRTGKQHHLSGRVSNTRTYARASHRLWRGGDPDPHDGPHDREAAEASAAWGEYLVAARSVLGAPTWSGAWDDDRFPVSFGSRSGPPERRRRLNPYRLAVWNPPSPESAVIVLTTFEDVYGRQSVDLELRDPAHIVLGDGYAEVEAKVSDVSSRGWVPEDRPLYGDPEPADKPDTTWQEVAAQLVGVRAWDWDAIFGDHGWNRGFTTAGELDRWARRLGWTVSGVHRSGCVSVTTPEGLSLWLPPVLRYPARVNWLEGKLWRISSQPASRHHAQVLEPAAALWADCLPAAIDILGEPGYQGDPDDPGFPEEWQSWRRETRGFKIHTRWLAIWPSPGEPAPAIGLFMQGGYMERRMDREAAQLDLRIWRPATPRAI
jgi:hypothetical protein